MGPIMDGAQPNVSRTLTVSPRGHTVCRMYRSKINVAVLQLLEREELQKLQKKWWYDKGECVVESDKVRHLDNSFFFFFLLLLLLIINIVVVVIACY